MKLLYVLVSKPSDYYYEQALLSIMSAKYRMPQIFISLLMDDETEKTLVDSRKKILDYTDEVRVIKCDPHQNPMVRSRFLKTMMREYIKGDFLYVDGDTLWVNPINKEDFSADIMGVPDGHVEFEKFIYHDYHLSLAKKLDFKTPSKFFINGGVLFLRDTPVVHEFMKSWNEHWNISCEKGCYTDQQSLNHVNYLNNNIIKLMPHSYNVQIVFTIRYLLNAKLIHYFGTGLYENEDELCFELQKKTFWSHVKENANIMSLFEDIATKPYKCFSTSSIKLNYKSEIELKNPIYGFINTLAKSSKVHAKILLKFFNMGARLSAALFSLLSKK